MGADERADGPDADGFGVARFAAGGFNDIFGELRTRAEGSDRVRVRVSVGLHCGNALATLHGGFLLAMLDQAIFVGPAALGRLRVGHAVTLNVATQFLGPGRLDTPLDCVVEIVRETGRLFFLRGQMEQGDAVLLTFQATLRKLGDRA